MIARHPTARRLITEGLRLFVECGFNGTPIVKLEAAAGLAPGSGAFYKHFKSKAALLAAAVEDAAANTHIGAVAFDSLEETSVEDQARFIARGAWLLFDAHRDLMLVLNNDVAANAALGPERRSRWLTAGPDLVAGWLRTTDQRLDDPDATSLALLDALTAYWFQLQTSSAPNGIDEERFLRAWIALATSSQALSAQPAANARTKSRGRP